jgi:glutaredoxin
MDKSHLLLASLLLVVACSDARPREGDAAPASARPDGWTSFEAGQSQRLYYQFVDERRQVRFVESLDEVPPALRAGVGFVKMSSPPPLTPGDARRARNAQVARSEGAVKSVVSQVVLYAADWCGACQKAKRYLARRGTAYEERNVDNPSVVEELLRKTGERGIPVLEAGGRILTGFSEPLYDELLDEG